MNYSREIRCVTVRLQTAEIRCKLQFREDTFVYQRSKNKVYEDIKKFLVQINFKSHGLSPPDQNQNKTETYLISSQSYTSRQIYLCSNFLQSQKTGGQTKSNLFNWQDWWYRIYILNGFSMDSSSFGGQHNFLHCK